MTQTEKQNVPKLRFPRFEEEWSISKIGDNAKVTTGSRDTKDRVEDGNYPFFVRSDNIERINSWALDCEAVITSGDGVGVGKNIHYVNGKFDFHQRVYAIHKFIDNLNGRFFYQFFKEGFLRRVMRLSAKNSVDSVRMSMITDMRLPIPSIIEQEKIASFLGSVDEKIDQLSRKKVLLEDYKKGCMQQIFSQKIRFKDDQGNDFSDWEEKRLGDVFSWINTNSLSRERLTLEGGNVQNIHYGDIHTKFSANFRQDFENIPFIKDAKKSDFPEEQFCQLGDVVIADASEDHADIGKAIEIVKLNKTPLVAGLHTYIARPCSESIQLGFPGYLLRSDRMRRQIERIAQGISVLGISKRNLERLNFLLPHPDEQRKIADFISALDTKIDLVAQELEHARLFKRGLLQQMFV